MSQNKKTYTNTDIIKKLELMDTRLSTIETWKIAQDAGKAAVDEYRRQENSVKATQEQQSVFDSIKTLVPYIVAVLCALAAVLYFHANSGTK